MREGEDGWAKAAERVKDSEVPVSSVRELGAPHCCMT